MLNIKKIKPMSSYLVTTMDKYTEDDVKRGGLMVKTVGSLKEYQKVIATGPLVRNIQVGDIVCINPRRYAKYKHNPGSIRENVIGDNPVVAYNFNVIELDHVEHLLLLDQDIDFIIEEYEEEKEPETKFVIPEKKIIV